LIQNQGVLYFGRVMNFRMYKEITKSDRTFYRDIVTVEPTNLRKLAVLMDPIFKILNFKKVEIKNFKNYLSLEKYKYHVTENADFSKAENKEFIKSALKDN